jgi:hypothetical protein
MKSYTLRNSESNIKPKLVEYLQDGILIRFDIKQEERTDMNDEISTLFKYKEFWFDKEDQNIEARVSENGFEFTDDYKQLLK